MSVLTSMSQVFRRSLMAAAIVATGTLALGVTTNPANAQAVYTYPYAAYSPYYPPYPYCGPYSPYYCGYPGPVVRVGWPDQFIEHASSVDVLRARYGLTAENIVAKARAQFGEAAPKVTSLIEVA